MSLKKGGVLNSFISTFIIFSFLVMVSSCGKRESNKSLSYNEELTIEKDDGHFFSKINVVNASLNSFNKGEAKIVISDEKISFDINISGADPGVKHLQFILTGDRCPNINDDKNQDGIIDVNELFVSSGLVLIPLDSDVSEQLLGIDFGPISNESGDYKYRRSATRFDLWSDLTLPDPDHYDQIVKLENNQKLQMKRRIIVIMGISREKELPSTVTSYWNLPQDQTIPVGCGVIGG